MATLRVRCESWPIRGTFTISRGSKTTADVVVVALSDTDGNLGRGEAVPYAYYGESLHSVLDQIESLHGSLAEGPDRPGLTSPMPAAVARHADATASSHPESQLCSPTHPAIPGQPSP